jgi:O-antigen/teichoic acid export membrane protein
MKRLVARNVIWNWAGVGSAMLVGFVVAPFLVRHLGETTYGLWILIASLTSYFGLLDLGTRGSVGRNVAFYRAKGDARQVNAILSTALAVLCTAGLVALLGTGVIQLLFFRLFDVPADQVAQTRLALLLIGINLGLSLPTSVFDAMLWAFQRFDVLNGIDIVTALVRTGLTFYFVSQGHGLVALATITLLTTLGCALAKAAFTFRLERSLAVGPSHLRRDAVGIIFSYGLWHFLRSLASRVNTQISPVLIGSVLGVGLVTVYSIAARLLTYATSLLSAGAGVLAPLAASLHAEEKHQQQQQMFLQGNKFALAGALFFLAAFLCLGKAFILLWMGPSLEYSYQLLVILALGEVLPMSQGVTHSTVCGLGQPRGLACIEILDNVVAVSLALVLTRPFGLAGVCAGVATSGFVFRGVVTVVYGCRLLKLPLWRYGREVVLPALAVGAPLGAALACLSSWAPPADWFGLFAYGGGYALCYALVGGAVLVGLGRLRFGGARLARAVLGTSRA